jgi:outer membrane protein insertion porin family
MLGLRSALFENRDLTPVVALLIVGASTLFPARSTAQTPTPQPGPILGELVLEGATVFSRDDVLWLLRLRTGERLPGPPDHVAGLLQRRYEGDGYSAARVAADYDDASHTLTLRVDEGRIDDVQFEGLPTRLVERFRDGLNARPGDIYNETTVRDRLDSLLAVSGGALVVADRGPDLVVRDTRRVLVIPIEQRKMSIDFGFGSESREDFYSPVDGFAPSVALGITRFDPSGFNHTFVGGHVSYKFGRDDAGYSLGIEQPLASSPRIFVGGEIHDITASDDLWRLSGAEQSLVALFFANSFRDYYRRRGGEVTGGARFGRDHELVASVRWDRHEALANETDFSFFRDDHDFRPNPPIVGGELNALVLAYTWDSRGVGDDASARAYQRHRLENLYNSNKRQASGLRIDWTSEIAGEGLGGDYEFTRHILNARGYLRLGRRQFFGARALIGLSGGSLPIERRFALGGIGSVHGYSFKESVGEEMTLFNAEYRLELTRGWGDESNHDLALIAFYDAGRVHDPIDGSRSDWLRGTGLGLQAGPVRVEFGFRTDAIPRSRQILVRVSPTF